MPSSPANLQCDVEKTLKYLSVLSNKMSIMLQKKPKQLCNLHEHISATGNPI